LGWKFFGECFNNNLNGSGWAYQIYDCNPYPVPPAWMTTRLVTDSNFVNKCHDRYYKLRQTILSEAHIFRYVDSIANMLNDAQIRHYAKWNTLGKISGIEILGTPEIDNIPIIYLG
jgi:hypothetical protein